MSPKLVLLAGFSALAFTQPVLAQQAAAAGSHEGGLEEIVVTAQKRQQNLQDVPVAVTALSAESLENKRINGFEDLTKAAPALTVSAGTNTNNSSINLRGIGTSAFSISVEPAVAVVVDDVALVQQAQAFNNLSGISRIEVLRGPQGTLFGKNASAGVVNIVTLNPTDHLSGGFQVSATSDREVRAEASLSGPIGNGGSGYRINGYYDNFDGNVTNLTNNTRLNGQNSYGLRAKFKLVLSDKLDVQLIGDASRANSNGTARTFLAVPAGAKLLGAVPLAPTITDITPGPDNYAVRFSDTPTSNSVQLLTSGKITYDLGGAKLISITSYQDWKYRFTEDLDVTDIDILSALTKGAAHGGIVQGGPFAAHQTTEELRLVSSTKSALSYLVGGYYADSQSSRSFTRGPVALRADWAGAAGSTTLAGFAQLDYQLGSATRATGGVRVNNQKINVAFTNNIASALPNNGGCNVTCAGNSSETATTVKASLQHDLARHVMVYASFATGYKGQGFDVSSGFTPARALNPVKAEHSQAYEIGLKSRFLDNRLQLNLTGFWTDYNNFQAQGGVIDPVTQLVSLQLANVGKLRTKGFEAELSAMPVKGLRLDGSAAYVDATIRSYPLAQCYTGQTAALGCVGGYQNLAGAGLANSPKFSFNLGAMYEVPLSADLSGFAALGYRHQSGINFDLFGNPLTAQQGYGVLDGSLGFKTGSEGQLKLTLFVNNILDQRYTSNIADNAGVFGGLHVLMQQLPRDSQRYGGARLKYDF